MIAALGAWTWTTAERLGGGGYAQAYRCRHDGFPDGEYVIKVFDNADYVNTFEKEVQALQTVAGCPGTLTLADHGRDAEGRLCIVTALAPGVRLDRLLRSGTLSLERTLGLLRQLLAVLACAHGKGLLHKDIKASNLLADGERYTLLDWGVAEPRGDGRSESIRAKQDFVAPECYYGKHELATDFYSLGWLTIHVLSGALPYHFAEVRDPDYRVAAHCMERPTLPENIPFPLRSLVLNWLDKNPARRLIGYDLDALLRSAPGKEADVYADLDFRQLRHECSFLHRAARHGVPYAQYHYALRLRREEGRAGEALYWLEKAREAGYVQASYRLARILSRGDEAARQRAAALMREAARAGHAGAQQRLDNAGEQASLNHITQQAYEE